MKKFMMKYLMTSCKEATFVMAKKEERKLSFAERIKLLFHTSMCSVCKKFENQTAIVVKQSKQIQVEDELPVFARERIEKMLEEHRS